MGGEEKKGTEQEKRASVLFWFLEQHSSATIFACGQHGPIQAWPHPGSELLSPEVHPPLPSSPLLPPSFCCAGLAGIGAAWLYRRRKVQHGVKGADTESSGVRAATLPGRAVLLSPLCAPPSPKPCRARRKSSPCHSLACLPRWPAGRRWRQCWGRVGRGAEPPARRGAPAPQARTSSRAPAAAGPAPWPARSSSQATHTSPPLPASCGLGRSRRSPRAAAAPAPAAAAPPRASSPRAAGAAAGRAAWT